MPTTDLGDYDLEPVEGDPFAGEPDQLQVFHHDSAGLGGIGADARYGAYPPGVSGEDRDYAIRTVAAEADHPGGEAAVTNVLKNRLASGLWGDTMKKVAMFPGEFSAWNKHTGFARGAGGNKLVDLPAGSPEYERIGNIVDKAWAGPDPTGGALNYYAPAGMPHGRPPRWASEFTKPLRIGTQIYGTAPEQNARTTGTRVAGDYASGGRLRYQDGGVTDLGEVDPDAGAPVPDAPPQDKVMTAQDIIARGGIGTISAYDPKPSERLRQDVTADLQAAGAGKTFAQDFGQNFSDISGWVPGFGQAQSLADAQHAFGQGNYGEAAINAAGAVPDVGPLAHAGLGAIQHALIAGPMALTADKNALFQASKMLKKGAPAEDIMAKTGWGRGAGGEWGFEIPDYGAQYTEGGWSLGDVLKHPDLYRAYPDLEHVPVDYWPNDPRLPQGGYQEPTFNPETRTRRPEQFIFRRGLSDAPGTPRAGQATPTALHEAQHAIQGREGFPRGGAMEPVQPGSPEFNQAVEWHLTPGSFDEYMRDMGDVGADARENYEAIAYDKAKIRAQWEASGRDPRYMPDQLHEAALQKASYDKYQSLAGEAESRNVEDRFRMGPLFSRVYRPWETTSLPYTDQILRYRAAGGRIGFADGGDTPDDSSETHDDQGYKLEAVNHDPFSASAGFAALDKMSAADRAAHPEQYQPPPQPEAPQQPTTWYGRWGQTLGGELGAAAGKAYEGYEWGAEKGGDLGAAIARHLGVDKDTSEQLGRDLETGIEDPPTPFGPSTKSLISRFAPELSALTHMAPTLAAAPLAVAAKKALSPEEQAAADAAKAAKKERGIASKEGQKISLGEPSPHPVAETPFQAKQAAPFSDQNFPDGRIATSVPTTVAEKATAHDTNARSIDMNQMSSNKVTYKNNADIIRGYDWLRLPEGATDADVHQALIDHVKANLLALYDAVPDDTKVRSQLWYDGANKIANEFATQYGRRPENMAGLLAALSPQRDWFMNVANARRVADVLYHQKNQPMTDAMERWGRIYASAKDPETKVTPEFVNGILDSMKGKTLSEMNSTQKAYFVRMYDAVYGPHPSAMPLEGANKQPFARGFDILQPEGTTSGRVARNKSKIEGEAGDAKNLTWGSMTHLQNAIDAYEAEDMPTISRAMGSQHKVRNFYNNIVNPMGLRGDVTIDTHAIAAGQLRPLGSSAVEVEHGLGMKGSTNGATGSKGLYADYAEAYRQAAKERGILPRQMQSITWEALRGLYTPAEKNSADVHKTVNDVWSRYRNGEIDMPEAQRRLLTKADGTTKIREPAWKTGDSVVEDED